MNLIEIVKKTFNNTFYDEDLSYIPRGSTFEEPKGRYKIKILDKGFYYDTASEEKILVSVELSAHEHIFLSNTIGHIPQQYEEYWKISQILSGEYIYKPNNRTQNIFKYINSKK